MVKIENLGRSTAAVARRQPTSLSRGRAPASPSKAAATPASPARLSHPGKPSHLPVACRAAPGRRPVPCGRRSPHPPGAVLCGSAIFGSSVDTWLTWVFPPSPSGNSCCGDCHRCVTSENRLDPARDTASRGRFDRPDTTSHPRKRRQRWRHRRNESGRRTQEVAGEHAMPRTHRHHAPRNQEPDVEDNCSDHQEVRTRDGGQA